MKTANKITSARITAMPKSFSDPMPQVMVTIDNQEHLAFEYYPDELQFSPDEFIGLTLQEARDLKVKKDIQYLQS